MYYLITIYGYYIFWPSASYLCFSAKNLSELPVNKKQKKKNELVNRVVYHSLDLCHISLYLPVCVCQCLFLQRLRSAFSLTSDDSPEKGPEEEVAEAGGGNDGLQEYASLKREPKAATSLPTWKSMDRLDNSSKSHTHRLFLVEQLSISLLSV